ncbi:MAG: hypothetical protein IJP78_10290 [Clostridia bacterium]|nr:hypothetical protein [Clostridia bacterium]
MHEETNVPDYSSEQEESSCDELEECHWDLYSVYEVHDEPPKEQLEYWKKKREANNALFDIDYQKFGKTEFFVYSRYAGSEHLQGKVKRLLFNDPLNQKAVFA